MAAESALTALLLRDALERTIASPGASWCWHALMERYETTEAEAPRAAMLRRLHAETPAQGVPGFLRATFLGNVTGDREYAALAGGLVQQIAPVDLERLMAFATYEWGRAVVEATDHAGFVTRLRAARLPEIMRLAGSHIRADAAAMPARRRIDRLGKVALLTPFIGLAGHTPTMLVLEQARLLRELGAAVHVFAGQELLMPHMEQYLGNRGRVAATAPPRDALARLIPAGVPVTLADERFSLQRRCHDLLGALAAFDPDLVMFVGLNSPLVARLYESRPVLGLRVHAVAPMAPVDVWLTADRSLAGRHSDIWGPAIPAPLGHHHPWRIRERPGGGAVTRAELAVEDAAIVLVTVGARLDGEIGGDWAAGMADMLARDPRLVWLLVGGSGTLPPALGRVPASRLRLIPHRENIRGLLRCCDIYVNPARLGGGFSVADAMAEGLPVVALANSDGGSKLADHAVGDLAAYFGTLRTLVASRPARERQGAALRALFAETLELARSGPSLLVACETTLERFRARRDGLAAAT